MAGKTIKERISAGEERLQQLELARDAALAHIGNLVHDSVPVDDDEVCFPPLNMCSEMCT